ncbi:uncharacterized protein VTP21DRAFT_5553 [Calcarisporiella thermophila]|uniref:uncharacterized protein n=1 Tax=Calcarisporiella thermophila TaxID=911321 RepID=UPI00374455E2
MHEHLPPEYLDVKKADVNDLDVWANAQFTLNNGELGLNKLGHNMGQNQIAAALTSIFMANASSTPGRRHTIAAATSTDPPSKSLQTAPAAAAARKLSVQFSDSEASHSVSAKENPAPTSSTSSESSSESQPLQDQQRAARLAAEEDKRRRNTAASARFRIKKKLREQALERTAREMTEKAERLEARVQELEREIGWLRALVTEKDPKLLELVERAKLELEKVEEKH